MYLLFLFALSASDPAFAGPKEEAHAEYVRLSQDLERLASKGAWAGVERTYQQCLATGEPLSFQDHLSGAYAARAEGDVTSAYARLKAANEIREERDVLDWLWDMDSNYGQVSLRGDAGQVQLAPGAMPFDPMQAKAVEFAQTQVATTGTFEGYLPQGEYSFAGMTIQVRPRVMAARIDVRTDEGIEAARKAAKKAEKEKEKE
jgi:hypothetical protein